MDSAINIPAGLNPSAKRTRFHAGSPRPFGHRERDAIACDPAALTTVPHLDILQRPADITRFVMAVIVDAIKRVLGGWARADVRDERFERVLPLVTHANAATAVNVEITHVRVSAPLFGVAPRHVFGRVCESVSKAALPYEFVLMAAARFHGAANKMIRTWGAFRSAVASASNQRMATVRDALDYRQAIEALADGYRQRWSSHVSNFITAGAA